MDSLPTDPQGCNTEDAQSSWPSSALLNVMLQLDAEGHARIIPASTDSAEYAEGCRRLRTWLRSEAVALLLEDVSEGGEL